MKVSLWIAAAMLVLVGCKPKSTGSAGGSSDPAAPKPIAVLADQLVKDYKANEVAADEKYKGKRLRVVAQIQSIDKDAFDNIQLHLKAEGSLLGVMAKMNDSEKTKVAGFQKLQAMTVECEGAGMIIGTPILKDCIVFSEGKPPAAAAKK